MHMKRLVYMVLFGFLVGYTPGLMAQTNEECMECHSDESLTTERRGREISLYVDAAVLSRSTHTNHVCVACHSGFDPYEMPHKEKIEPVNCMAACHKDVPLSHRFHPQIINASGTDGTPDVSCKTCHGRHDVVSHRHPDSKFHTSNLTEGCGQCHTEVYEEFVTSAHNTALTEGITDAPSCIVCHQNGIVQVTAAQDTVQLKIMQQTACLSCHLDNPNVRARITPTAGFIVAPEENVHGAILYQGNGAAPNCSDCHGNHDTKKVVDPNAPPSKRLIPDACQRCHADKAQEFAGSIHAAAVLQDNKEAPACNDCHHEHGRAETGAPGLVIAAGHVSGQICTTCHSPVKITESSGIGDRFQNFSDSFHGLMSQAGLVEASNCASCHDSHDIKLSSDPSSPVHKVNLGTTCGNCHPAAASQFALGSVHVTVDKTEHQVLSWITNLYIGLMVILVGGMIIHNLPDFLKRSGRMRQRVTSAEPSEHEYIRMTMNERLQHGALMVSFIILAITGFMLHYPESWWVIRIRMFSELIFDLASPVHLLAALMIIGVSLWHIVYAWISPRGRELIRDLIPGRQDAADLIHMLKYNFGLSSRKPPFGRFNYIEKIQYWVVTLSIILITVTGVVMWIDSIFVGFFSVFIRDINKVLHFYQTWFAALFIIVWHLYRVVFNPDVYPMNTAWVKGTLNESEMAEEHPVELEAIRSKDEYVI